MFSGCQNAFTKCKLHTVYMNFDIYGKTLSCRKKIKVLNGFSKNFLQVDVPTPDN